MIRRRAFCAAEDTSGCESMDEGRGNPDGKINVTKVLTEQKQKKLQVCASMCKYVRTIGSGELLEQKWIEEG